jgi:hypothetical protein
MSISKDLNYFISALYHNKLETSDNPKFSDGFDSICQLPYVKNYIYHQSIPHLTLRFINK